MGGDGKGGGAGSFTENRTLFTSSEEQQKRDAARKKTEDITNMKAKLLGALTEQLKSIMTKLNEPSVSEAKKEALQAMLAQIKAKMDAFSAPPTPQSPSLADQSPGPGSARAEPFGTPTRGKGKGGGGWGFNLDLRSRVLCVNIIDGWTQDRLREELRKLDVADHEVQDVLWQTGSDGQTSTEFSLIRFKDRTTAERLLKKRSELPFKAEWCENQSLPPTSPTATFSAASGAIRNLNDELEGASSTPADAGAETRESGATSGEVAPAAGVASAPSVDASAKSAENGGEVAPAAAGGAAGEAGVAEGGGTNGTASEKADPNASHSVDLNDEE